MSKIYVVNISKEPRRIRPSAAAEKVTIKPGERLECDRDYAESNCLKSYSEFFRAEGGANPELKEVLKFLEKATDEEKAKIAKVIGEADLVVEIDASKAIEFLHGIAEGKGEEVDITEEEFIALREFVQGLSQQTIKHTVTKEDLKNNPDMAKEGVKEGDKTELPKYPGEPQKDIEIGEAIEAIKRQDMTEEAKKQILDEISTIEPVKPAKDEKDDKKEDNQAKK